MDFSHLEEKTDSLDIADFLLGYTGLDADVEGQAIGWNGVRIDDLDLTAASTGEYWTHIVP